MAGDDARTLGARLDALLEGLQDLPDPDTARRVEELVGALVELYGTGLEHVVRLLRAEPGGEARVRALTEDELVAHLLLLHDLHPDDVDTRVQRALDKVRPYLGSHAGGVEYLGVAGGVARLRLEGSCDGCPSSSVTVKLAVEQAVLEAAPEVESVAVEGMVRSGGELPLLQIQPFHGGKGASGKGAAAPDDGWQALELTTPDGHTQAARLGDLDVVVCNLAGTPYAYRDSCPVCAAALHGGELDGDALSCPGCGHRFDVRLAGRGVDGPASLEALPVLPDGAGWRIAVPHPAGV